MIWEVEKGGRVSFLAGTAHFFPYSFKTSITKYAKEAQNICLEGPLGPESMNKVREAGLMEPGSTHLFADLDAATIDDVNDNLMPHRRKRSSSFLVESIRPESENPVFEMVKDMKPWMTFFTLWTEYLELKGWKYSVDMEGFTGARELDKQIVFLETIEEQIQALESLPYERIINFLERVALWDTYIRDYAKRYLAGDFLRLKSMGIGFPSRAPSVIKPGI